MCLSIDQHDIEIQLNRDRWNHKPLLRKAYAQFYSEIARYITPQHSGQVVELGSGIGIIKEHIPEAKTTDIFPNPWLDQVENAYSLSFLDGEVGHLILFDVLHHLRYPGTALQEFSRVLAPGGRMIIFEPAMGHIGRFVFGHFHHEPLGLENEIEWTAPGDFATEQQTYYAAQGNASRIFGAPEFEEKLQKWQIVDIKYFSGISYIATGGFRGPQLCPGFLWPFLNIVDTAVSRCPKFASRMLIVLEKNDG